MLSLHYIQWLNPNPRLHLLLSPHLFNGILCHHSLICSPHLSSDILCYHSLICSPHLFFPGVSSFQLLSLRTMIVPFLDSFHLAYWPVLMFYQPCVWGPAASLHPCTPFQAPQTLMGTCSSANHLHISEPPFPFILAASALTNILSR